MGINTDYSVTDKRKRLCPGMAYKKANFMLSKGNGIEAKISCDIEAHVLKSSID